MSRKGMIFFFGIVCFLNLPVSVLAQESAASAPQGDRPWVEVQNRISSLSAKHKQLDHKLKDLIRVKKSGVTSDKMVELDTEIAAAYKQWKESAEELSRENKIFRYRFPERAARTDTRTYNVDEVPSLQAVEEMVGVEGKMKRNLQRMRDQYGEAASGKQKPSSKPEPQAPSIPVEPEGKTILESDSPILRK